MLNRKRLHELADLEWALAQQVVPGGTVQRAGPNLQMGGLKMARPDCRWHVPSTYRAEQTTARKCSRSQDDRYVVWQQELHMEAWGLSLTLFHERTPPVICSRTADSIG